MIYQKEQNLYPAPQPPNRYNLCLLTPKQMLQIEDTFSGSHVISSITTFAKTNFQHSFFHEQINHSFSFKHANIEHTHGANK